MAHSLTRSACTPLECLGILKDLLSVGHSLHAECLEVPKDRLSLGPYCPRSDHPTSVRIT